MPRNCASPRHHRRNLFSYRSKRVLVHAIQTQRNCNHPKGSQVHSHCHRGRQPNPRTRQPCNEYQTLVRPSTHRLTGWLIRIHRSPQGRLLLALTPVQHVINKQKLVSNSRPFTKPSTEELGTRLILLVSQICITPLRKI